MMLRHLPNLISFARILLVPPTVWALFDGEYRLALLLFFIAGFSDGVDGYLARRFDWRSRLGGIIDPLADKALMVSVFVSLAMLDWIPVWLAAVVIGRDLIIVTGGVAYHFFIQPVEGEPTWASKINTVFQLLYVTAVLSAAGYAWPVPWVLVALGSAMFVTTVVSGIDYFWSWGARAYRTGRRHGR